MENWELLYAEFFLLGPNSLLGLKERLRKSVVCVGKFVLFPLCR